MKARIFVLSIAWIFLVSSSVFATDRLVPSVYPTIQGGIDAAENGDVVIVAAGTYTGSGNKDLDFGGKAITVRSSDPEDPNVVAATIIDCEKNGRGFYFHSGETASSVVAGLTITNGHADQGGGIYCDSSSPMIRNCVFSGNRAWLWGGGVENNSCSPTVTNCVFTGNIADWYGGGMDNYNCPSLVVTNCIFAGNTSYWGGGMENDDSSPTIINCTFSGNDATYGGGIDNYGSSSPNVSNCILWGDSAFDGPEIYGGCAVSYSDVEGGYPGTGNIDADPCFVDAVSGDYHLDANSPCINAGDPNYVATPDETDIDGEPRVMGGRVDMGADEFRIATMRKGPYLLFPGNNAEMMVLWQLDITGTCALEWGLDTSYSDGSVVTTEYGTDHQHKHRITALTPGSEYYYQVTVGGSQHPGSFRAAPPADACEVGFLGYGDTRTNVFDHDTVDEAMVDVFEADPNYHTFTLHSGDWVDDGEEEEDWTNEFFNPGALNTRQLQANLPINGCIGNHEYDDDSTPRTYYHKYWPYPYVDGFCWSFDYGPVHIAVLDQYEEDYSPGSSQYNWLVNDLSSTDREWKILQLHEPGYSAGHHGDEADVQNWIQPLCEEHGVDIVFCGHNHYYARCDKNGVKHITSGGGGAPLRDGSLNYSEYVEVYVKTYHFCKIHINGRGLDFEAVQPDGTVIDSFTLAHYAPCDFDVDWDVDWLDLKDIADRWLERCRVGDWCDGRDIDKSSRVDFFDFTLCAEDWLVTGP